MTDHTPTTPELAYRLTLLEAYISHLYQVAGVAMPSPQALLAGMTASPAAGVPAGAASPDMMAIEELARSGNKIEAIKRYRALTGAGLADAKAAIESIG